MPEPQFLAMGGALVFCLGYLAKLNTLTFKEFLYTQLYLHMVCILPMFLYWGVQRCAPSAVLIDTPKGPETLPGSADCLNCYDAAAGKCPAGMEKCWGNPANLRPNPEWWPAEFPAMPQVAQFLCYLFTYLSFTIPMVWFYKPYPMPHEGIEVRQTKKYKNAAIVGCIEHIVYFLLFVGRQFENSSAAQDLDMRRPLEQEFKLLVNSYVLPIWPGINVPRLLHPYVSTQDVAIQSVSDWVITHPSYGNEFWWYQCFEGVNHGMIVVGSAMVIFPSFFAKLLGGGKEKHPFENILLSRSIYWLYEYAMIAELIVYGPQYFWMLTNNFFQMWLNSEQHFEGGLSSAEGQAGVAAAFFVCLMHHAGYWVDSYGSWEIARAWGWVGQKDKEE